MNVLHAHQHRHHGPLWWIVLFSLVLIVVHLSATACAAADTDATIDAARQIKKALSTLTVASPGEEGKVIAKH